MYTWVFPLTVVGFYSLVDLIMGLASRLRNSLGLSLMIIALVFPLLSAFMAFVCFDNHYRQCYNCHYGH